MTLSVSIAAAGKRDTAIEPLDCVINPSVVADLGSGVPGILSRVQVDRSDFVKAGAVVAELESSVESAALELARARAALTAEVDLRRVNAAFGQRQNKRTKDLFSRKAISTNDMDQRETESRLAQIQLRQARDNKDLAQLEMLRAHEILRRRTITSPIDGVVMDRFKVIGEYVEDQPVVRVAQIDPLHVEVIVPVEQLGTIRDGMYAEVWSENVEGETWHATVSRVDQVADVASGTFGVRLTMPNPDQKIPAGLRCRMQLVEKPVVPVEETTAEVVEPEPEETLADAYDEPAIEKPVITEKPVEQTSVIQLPAGVTPIRRVVKSAAKEVEPKMDVTEMRIVASAPEVVEKPIVPKMAKSAPVAIKPIERAVKSDAKEVKPQMDVTELRAVASTPEVVEKPGVQKVVKSAPAAIKPVERALSSDTEPAEAKMVIAKFTARVTPTEAVQEVTPTPAVAAVVEKKATVAAAVSVPDNKETEEVEPVNALPECRLAGPYTDEVRATKKVVTLRRAGLYVDIKSVPSSIFSGYMIASPVLPSRAEAKGLVARLKAAGITDYYVPRKRSSEMRVSLGLYNSKKIAQREIDKLVNKGFTAELLPWKKKGSQHFLVIRGTPSEANGKLLANLPVPDGSNESTHGFCNQLAGR